MTAPLFTPDERRQFGQRFSDLLDQGVGVPEIAERFAISEQSVRRCLLAIDMPAVLKLVTSTSLLDPETIAMLHKFRDEIQVADRIAMAREGRG